MKIFGVGPNKTGTVSIRYACERLGLRVLHDREKGERLCRALRLADSVIDELDNYDVFLDGPYHEVINEIRNFIDDPRFMRLHRDFNDWVNSRIVHCLHNHVMDSETVMFKQEFNELYELDQHLLEEIK